MNKILVLLLMMFALSACNTVEGMGKDIQDLGKSIEDSGKSKDY